MIILGCIQAYFLGGILFDIFAIANKNKFEFFKDMLTYRDGKKNSYSDEEWKPQYALLEWLFIWPFCVLGGIIYFIYKFLMKGFEILYELVSNEKIIPEEPDPDLIKAQREVENFLMKG